MKKKFNSVFFSLQFLFPVIFAFLFSSFPLLVLPPPSAMHFPYLTIFPYLFPNHCFSIPPIQSSVVLSPSIEYGN